MLTSDACVKSMTMCPDCATPFTSEENIKCESIIRCLQMVKVEPCGVETKEATSPAESQESQVKEENLADINKGSKSIDKSDSDDGIGVEDVRPASASALRVVNCSSSNSLRAYSSRTRNSDPKILPISGSLSTLPAPPSPPPQNPTTTGPVCQFCKDSPVVSVCQDCTDIANLCEDCFAFRHRKGEMVNHRSAAWNPSGVSTMCQQHLQDCLVFCTPCNVPICALCAVGEHSGHDTVVIAEAMTGCKERLQTAISNLEQVSKEVQLNSLCIYEKYKEIAGISPCFAVDADGTQPQLDMGIYAPVIESIEKHFDSLGDILEARRRELVDTVHAIRKAKLNVLSDQLNESALYVAQNYAVGHQLKQKLKHESNAFLYANEGDITSEIVKRVSMKEYVPRVPAVSSDIQFLAEASDVPLPVLPKPDTRDGGGGVGGANADGDGVAGEANRTTTTSSSSNSHDSTLKDMLRSIGKVVSNDVDPVNCVIVGETLLRALTVNKEVVLTLHVKDKQGVRVSTGGDNVTCSTQLSPLNTLVEGSVRVSDNGDGSYGLACRFSEKGDMTLRVFVRGVQIGASPIYFTVSNALRYGTIGDPGAGEGQLLNPQGICCHEGMLYVSDQANKRVQVFGLDGSYVWSIGSWGRGRRQLQSVSGVAYYDNMLYVSDSQNHRVHVFDRDGAYVRYIGGRGIGPGQLQNPTGVCCCQGLLYVSDSANDRVQVFQCDGAFVRTIGQNLLQHPTGICCDNGLLYVCDSDNDRVQVFGCSDVKAVRSIGGWGSGPGQMIGPTDVCVMEGLLCVSDRGNNRVQIFDKRDGGFLRCLKDWKSGRDGQIQLPKGLCHYEGLLYVSDIDDHKVYIFNSI
jgi:hypothetical protein